MDFADRIKVAHSDSIELIVENPTELRMISKGAHGAVFLLPDGKCMKIYAEEKNAAYEANTYKKAQGSYIMPKLYDSGKNYIIIEFLDGITLSKYLRTEKKMSYEVAYKIVSLLKEMKRLGFSRMDTALNHVIITKTGGWKVIDLVYAYVRTDAKPRKVLTGLKNIGLLEVFLSHVESIDNELYKEWTQYVKTNAL